MGNQAAGQSGHSAPVITDGTQAKPAPKLIRVLATETFKAMPDGINIAYFRKGEIHPKQFDEAQVKDYLKDKRLKRPTAEEMAKAAELQAAQAAETEKARANAKARYAKQVTRGSANLADLVAEADKAKVNLAGIKTKEGLIAAMDKAEVEGDDKARLKAAIPNAKDAVAAAKNKVDDAIKAQQLAGKAKKDAEVALDKAKKAKKADDQAKAEQALQDAEQALELAQAAGTNASAELIAAEDALADAEKAAKQDPPQAPAGRDAGRGPSPNEA